MNPLMAKEWLAASFYDLELIQEIQKREDLSHLIAFHSQQSVEKSFKALLELHEQTIPKKHDLLKLKDMVAQFLSIEDEFVLERLNELYVDSRYPGEFGLLPNGKPSPEESRDFFHFARNVYEEVKKILSKNS